MNFTTYGCNRNTVGIHVDVGDIGVLLKEMKSGFVDIDVLLALYFYICFAHLCSTPWRIFGDGHDGR